MLPFREWIAEVIKVKERILTLRIKGIDRAYIALGVARVISEVKISAIIHDYCGYEERQPEENSNDYADHISYLSFIIYICLEVVPGRGSERESGISHWCRVGALDADWYIEINTNMFYLNNNIDTIQQSG